MNLERLAPARGQRLAVLGGCGGIGSRLVEAARTNGLDVAIVDLPRSIAENPPPDGIAAFPCDATDPGQVAKAFEAVGDALGGLDHLVYLAGFAMDTIPVEDLDIADFEEVMDGSLKTTLLACRAAIPLLRADGGGSIVNMSSDLGFIGRVGYAGYAAAKAALVSLTRTLAIELAPDIRCNVVSPAAVETAFLSGGTGRGGKAGATGTRTNLEAYVKTVPLGRVANAEDIVGPILFLMSDAARYVTAQVLHVDGGWMHTTGGGMDRTGA